MSGNLQSLCWASYALAQVLTASMAGSLAQELGPRAVLELTSVFPLMAGFAALTMNEAQVWLIILYYGINRASFCMPPVPVWPSRSLSLSHCLCFILLPASSSPAAQPLTGHLVTWACLYCAARFSGAQVVPYKLSVHSAPLTVTVLPASALATPHVARVIFLLDALRGRSLA